MLKKTASLFLSIFLAAGFSFWITTKQAHAYIDLSSAGFILQMLFAGFFGGLFALKMFWGRVVNKMSRVVSMLKGTKETP